MSLKGKFEGIKQVVGVKKTQETFEEGKRVFGDIENKKKTLTDRINGLKELVNQLEGSYSSARKGSNDFAEADNKIKTTFNEYTQDPEFAAALKRLGVKSVEELLASPDFSNEEEIVDYHKKGAAKLRKNEATQTEKLEIADDEDEKKKPEKRGELGERVKELASVKGRVKKELPEMDLNFRGRVKAGETISPREASILKIKDYIKELEKKELAEVQKKEKEAKAEYLPKIKEIISNRLEEIFPAAKGYSVAPAAANINFITDEVFELCGDELWPEVKNAALILVRQKFEERKIDIRSDGIDKSLEAEKFIFDVSDLRNKNENLLKLDRDKDNFSGLGRETDEKLFQGLKKSGEEVEIKDNLMFPKYLLQQAEYFKEKNVEVKKVLEKTISELIPFYTEAKNEFQPGIFTGGKNEKAMKEAKNILDQVINGLKVLKVPENYYNGNDRWGFHNNFFNTIPGESKFRSNPDSYKWLSALYTKASEKYEEMRETFKSTTSPEDDKLNKLSNDLYNYSSSRYDGKINVSGFDVPVVIPEKGYRYPEITNKKRVDSFLKSLNDQTFSQEELAKKFKEEEEIYAQEIKNYPNSEEIINRFKQLSEKYDKVYRYNSDLLNTKNKAKTNQGYVQRTPSDSFIFKKELFYL